MQDLMNPPLIWLGNRCFRKNNETEYTVRSGYTGEEEDYTDLNEVNEDEEQQFQHSIEEYGGGFKAVLQVSSNFFSQIIGKGAQTKTRLEKETGTRINIPKKGLEGDIVVSGSQKPNVIRCCNRIDVIVVSARQKHAFTHFISLPMNTQHLQQEFHEFKREVLDNCSECRGVEESIFQTSTLLHLTVGTMVLMDDRERALARNILQDCKELIILPKHGEAPFEVEIHGLEIMNDDPGEVDVLYGKVKESGELQEIAEQIVDKFVDAGLMKREYDRIKFHVTLMNTLFRKDKTDVGDKNDPENRESFDARTILNLYSERRFGKVDISEIHLSQRRAGRRSAEGYYLPSHILKITSCG
eukprot:TRINITY_DN14616_c0_g1_i1.p1 TRINITY_DN14616_c0_g1~~TRINITY_DN14616_c0_g1_i1.p1  ORF type:complete len:356 (+),score=78.36 TRINITY_DN14616_c0_g1_i1:43-1110(+)